MNALPINKSKLPSTIIDDLIADFGLKTVLLALAARIVRRRREKGSTDFPGLSNQPGLEGLGDHLRRDLGLPPAQGRKIYVDPILLMRRDYY
jgi:hypothetical protein